MGNNRMLDFILIPKKIYERLTDSKAALFAGIIFIGTIDIAFPGIVRNYLKLFVEKPSSVLTYNVSLLLLSVVLVGLLDVVFFSVPLFDLFKVFKKKKDSPIGNAHRIKLMKVYILAHFIILPISILYEILFRHFDMLGNPNMFNLAFLIELIVALWFSAAISKGINVIYNFDEFFRKLVFLVVVLWNYLMGWALSFIINNWVMGLFK